MEKQANFFKKAKTWNMVTLVINAIGVVGSLFLLPTLINPTGFVKMMESSMAIVDDPAVIATTEQTIAQMTNPAFRIYSLVSLILSVALLVFYFIANKKFKSQQTITKLPYYLALGLTTLSIITSLMSGNITVPLLLSSVLLSIPIILVLVNLFKLDSDEDELN